MRLRKTIGTAVATFVAGFAGAAFAAAPTPWQMGFQPPVTPVADLIHSFHDMLLVIITVIALFVFALLMWTLWKFRASKNPVPTKTTHNTLLEMAWTVIPVIILVIVAVPSFKLLYFEDVVPKADMTIKAIGKQWFWTYEYPDNGKFSFDSLMVPADQLKPGQRRLLETDNSVVVPVNTTVRVIVTAEDVLHAWAMPAFGVKIDAVPGRLNETWFKATKEGTYYGQCSELCGVNHGFMPIRVEVVSRGKFDSWVAGRKKAALDGTAPAKLAELAAPAR